MKKNQKPTLKNRAPFGYAQDTFGRRGDLSASKWGTRKREFATAKGRRRKSGPPAGDD